MSFGIKTYYNIHANLMENLFFSKGSTAPKLGKKPPELLPEESMKPTPPFGVINK